MSYNEKLIELKNMKQTLLSQIEAAQREITRHETNGISNHGEYNGLRNSLSTYQERLKEVMQQIAELEGVGDEIQIELENEFEDFAGTGLSLRGIISQLSDKNLEQNPEDVYQLIAIYIKQKTVDMANEQAAVVHSYKTELNALEQTVSELSKIKAEYEAIYAENIKLGEEVDDLTAKREAAMKEVDAFKADNARLKEDAAKLREQLEKRNNVSNGPSDPSEFAARIRANRKTIYDVVADNPMSVRKYFAKLADTHEPIEFPYYALGGYNVLEGEELARFQAELEEKRLAEQAKEATLLAPPLSMPNAPVSTDSIPGEVAPETETVTREEFEALKQQVNALEQRVRVVA